MFPFIKSPNTLVNIFIILLAVAPAFALGEGNKNLLLIGAMCFSPYFFIKYPVILPKIDIPLTSICLMMISFTVVFHPETLRWSTLMYSCLFCMFFMSFARVLSFSDYKAEDFAKLIKWLLYAYCITLMIQQFCVLTGLPIFNLANYSVKEPWKLNSLMSEPSHSARIIPVLMYIFVCYQKNSNPELSLKDSIKESKSVWGAFMWCILTMGSTTGFIFLIIVIAKFIGIKKILPSIFLMLTIFVFFVYSNNKYVKRTTRVIVATLTLDEKAIIKADHSASFRIVPSIQGAKAVSLADKEGWVGHGVDADSHYIKPLPSVKNGNAGSFYMWFNYGVICTFTYWIFTLLVCYQKHDMVSVLIWLLCIFMYGGINNQIIWLTLILLYAQKTTQKKI